MKWIIGIDLRPLSHGALQFGSWMVANAGAEPVRFVPVHVLEDDHLRAVLRYHHLDEVVRGATEEARRALERHGRPEWIDDLEVVQALHADERLEAARASAGAEAIVVGRAAGRHAHRVVRLGRVARRLLRALPSPVIVVPPDLHAGEIGPGPVVAATSAGGDAVEAVRFAAAFARRTARELALVHVVRDPASDGLPFVPAASLARAREDEIRDGERALAAWTASAGVTAGTTAVLQGNVVERAITFAEEQRAPLLVVGARHRTGVDRALVPSIGREMAATSAVPVAVVPVRA